MVRAFDIKKEYKDCFTSETPEALVATLHAYVQANRFPGKGRTLWTLYNQQYITFRGPVLEIIHTEGARYLNVWTGKPIYPKIINGKAVITATLEPQGIGCVAQLREQQ